MRNIIIATIAILLSTGCTEKAGQIVILHTNDTHSHILPEKNGNGGVLNRAQLIEDIRDSLKAENTLLLDCGDFSQGSLFYNVFRGEFEIDIMNEMHYDAGTLGNHEFDMGMTNLAKLIRKAKFPILCANYIFDDTPCEGLVKEYTIIERGGRKIGLFGLSPDPDGLVLKENYEGVKFISPIEAAKKCVSHLKADGCDAIICLSHLGWKISNKYNDERLAKETEGIDIIIGGHSHDLFKEPILYKNSAGQNVVMNQTGKYGRNLGFLSISFN